MKKRINRVILAIPLAFVLVFSCIVPFASLAITKDVEPPLDMYQYTYISPEAYVSYAGRNLPNNYLYVTTYTQDTYSFDSYLYLIDLGSSSFNITNDGNIYTITFDTIISDCYSYCWYRTITYPFDSCAMRYYLDLSLNDYYDFDTLVIDTSTYTFHAYKNGSLADNFFRLQDNTKAELFLNGSLAQAKSIEVSFEPDLSGTISQSTSINGQEVDYKFVTMHIENKTNVPYQYAWFIVNKGEEIDLDIDLMQYMGTSTDLNSVTSVIGKFYNNNPIFTYITDEWFWTYLSAEYRRVNAPSAWHYLYPNGSQYPKTSWYHLDLKPNVEYDCVVIATPLDLSVFGNTSCSPVVFPRNLDFSLLYDDLTEVYRSTFKVSTATPYDPEKASNSTPNYVSPSGADDTEVYNKLNAYYPEGASDPVVVNSSDFSHFGNNSYGSSNGGSVANFGSSISITSGFSSVYNFILSFIKFLPSPIPQIFTFGFLGLVVIALFKAVR